MSGSSVDFRTLPERREPSREGLSFPEEAQLLGRQQPGEGGAFGPGFPREFEARDTALLERGAVRGYARGREGQKGTERGLMAHQSDLPPCIGVAQSAKHRLESSAWGQRFDLDRLRPGENARKDLRGLAGTHERARQDLVEPNSQRGKSADGLLELCSTLPSKLALRIPAPGVLLFRFRMANDIDLHGCQSTGFAEASL